MGFMTEFKEFAVKGNVMDMAVGIIIGGAFGKIVSSAVNDVVMPPVGLAVGGVDFSDLKLMLKPEMVDAAGKTVEAVTLNYGSFLQTSLDFILLALAVFIMVKGINSLKRKEEAAPEAPAEPPKQEVLLAEIRDLLKK